MERQLHGFNFEEAVATALGATRQPSYLSKYDLLWNGDNVSVKTVQNRGELCLGSLRNNQAAEDHWLIAGQHDGERIVNIVVWRVQGAAWQQHVQLPNAEAYLAEFALITNARIDDERWTDFRHRIQRAWGDRVIALRCKRDHKVQKRIQCAVSARTLRAMIRGDVAGAERVPTPPELAPLIGTPLRPDARSLDKFLTQPDVARELTEWLATRIPAPDVVLEPSAGAGAFVSAARSIWPEAEILAYDIAPDSEDIERQDFLQADFLQALAERLRGRSVLALGNPPFGRNSVLALAFINACAPFANHVAMIVPRAMEKLSVQRRVSARLAWVTGHQVRDTAFTLDDAQYHVPTTFMLWGAAEAAPAPAPAPARQVPGIRYIPKGRAIAGAEPFDLEVQRVGGNAGFCWAAADAPRRSYNYFLKIDAPYDSARVMAYLAEHFAELQVAASRATGPKSLSMTELAPVLRAALG